MSALPSVNLVLDLYVGRDLLSSGSAALKPSAVLTDVQDQAVVTRQPVTANFGGESPPVVPLIPTDDPNLEPSGWTWGIAVNAAGAPAAYSFFLPAGPADFTATHATPCVFTFTPTTQLTELPNGTGVQLSGGSLPAGFTAETTYYVVSASEDTFELAATSGGDPIASTGTGSGSATVAQWNLSAVTPVTSTTMMTPYLPLPGGTPSSGEVPVATGDGNATAWGSPGNAATATNLAGGATFPGYVAPTVTTLADGSSVAMNAALGNDFRWSLGGSSHTLAAPSNPVNGQPITIAIKYGGSYTPLFNAVFDFGAGGQPAWTATSGKTDYAGFRYDSALNADAGEWAFQGAVLGLTS